MYGWSTDGLTDAVKSRFAFCFADYITINTFYIFTQVVDIKILIGCIPKAKQRDRITLAAPVFLEKPNLGLFKA